MDNQSHRPLDCEVNHLCNSHMQGFPDEEGPVEMKRRAGAAVLEHHNQYPPMHGIPELRQVMPPYIAWWRMYIST